MTGAPASVAVIGGGRMGRGIAHAFLAAGSLVQLRDVSDSAAAEARTAVEVSLTQSAERGKLAAGPAEALSRLSTAAGVADVGSVDLVIEAVPEIPELKESVWREVGSQASATTILATNTSSISVAALAKFVPYPAQFLGMHFFNPVPSSKLVELIRTPSTSAETLDLATGWTSAIGKDFITVADAPGFATSRLGLIIGLEAIRMVESGVASAEEIDKGMMLGYGFPVGPLKLTDMVGLDIRLEIAEYLHSQLGSRFEPPELLRTKVAAGELGRKTGRGFYDW